MNDLIVYIEKHTEKIENIERNEKWDLISLQKSIDVYFFSVVTIGNPTVEEFSQVTKNHKGAFSRLNPLDGDRHWFPQIGAWVGDDSLALRYMALGSSLGLWNLYHPKMLVNFNDLEDVKLCDKLAQLGLIFIYPLEELNWTKQE